MTEGTVLWRVAAGPRIGFGHLVRSTSLARALGIVPVISLRSGATARRVAKRLGARLAGPSLAPAIARCQPRLVIVDDPSRVAAEHALTVARRAGTRVVSLHDLGMAWIGSDLLVDGSVVQRRRPAAGQRALIGPRYAVLNVGIEGSVDRSIVEDGRSTIGGSNRRFNRPASIPQASTIPQSTNRPIDQSRTVLITLGGGPRVSLARAIAGHLVALDPSVRVRIAGGFGTSGTGRMSASSLLGKRPSTQNPKFSPSPMSRVTWLGRRPTLAPEFDECAVAIVGGGVSAYEACARGTAAVAVAVVPAQRGTVAGLAAAGAVLDGGLARGRAPAAFAGCVAAQAVGLMHDVAARRRLASRAKHVVDGRGASRVARAVRELMRAA